MREIYNLDLCEDTIKCMLDMAPSITNLSDNEVIVKYESAKAVTPGQACVIYLGSEVIGGGIIKEVRKDGTKLWYL